MKQHILALASLALVGSFSTTAHAGLQSSASPATFSVASSPSSITISFTSLDLLGYEFLQLFGSITGPAYGTLTGVSVNATLEASVDYVWANDLTLYVIHPPLDFGGLLQVGSVGDLGAAETIPWANGDDSAPGTTVIDTVTLSTPLTFVGDATDPDIWLGNGYSYFGDEEGVWTGSITLIGLSDTAAPVPEPETAAMFLAGSAGLLAFMARRRRKAAHAALAA